MSKSFIIKRFKIIHIRNMFLIISFCIFIKTIDNKSGNIRINSFLGYYGMSYPGFDELQIKRDDEQIKYYLLLDEILRWDMI